MYCGRVKEVVVFGESYVSDAPQRAVFEGQSHRNYSGQEFRSYYQRLYGVSAYGTELGW